MGLIECDECGESVDDAKAFCPECGNSLIDEEQRQVASSFEKLDSTVQLGQTMYNQMLSDMGLDISKRKDEQEKRTSVISPIQTKSETPSEKPLSVPISRISKRLIVWIIAGVLLIAILIVLIAIILVLWMRLPNL